MGLPTGGDPHGNGVLIVPACDQNHTYQAATLQRGSRTVRFLCQERQYSTGSASYAPRAMTRLDKLSERCSQHPEKPVDREVYKLICDPELLELAYNNIKSNPGNMTPGLGAPETPEGLDGISHEFILKVADELKDETYAFKPGRRTCGREAAGTSKRPLTIAPPRDKIVQEAMRMILEAIYEPTFLDSSHGFRMNRSCHTALRDIYTKFKACT